MGLFDNLQVGLSRLSKNTKKAVNTTKIEFKIRGYSNEADDILREIGRIAYESRDFNANTIKGKVNDLYADLDNINRRINNLEKTLTGMKSTMKDEKNIIVASGSKNYAKLDKKDEDLTIKRTSEGIRILRFCPECRSENNSNDQVCSNCGHTFKKAVN